MSTVFMVLADYDHSGGRAYCGDESIGLLGVYTTLEKAEERQREIEAKRIQTRITHGYGDFDSKYDLLLEQFRSHQISVEEFETKEIELFTEEEEIRQNARYTYDETEQMYLCMMHCYIKKYELDTPITEHLFGVSYYE